MNSRTVASAWSGSRNARAASSRFHSAAPASEKSAGSVVVITHGEDDPARAILALILAERLPAGDNHVWFSLEGGPLCKRGAAEKISSPVFEKQGTAEELLAKIKKNGAQLHICPACAAHFGVKGEEAMDDLDEKGADWLLPMMATHRVVWL